MERFLQIRKEKKMWPVGLTSNVQPFREKTECSVDFQLIET
jgi:hypothetical protein